MIFPLARKPLLYFAIGERPDLCECLCHRMLYYNIFAEWGMKTRDTKENVKMKQFEVTLDTYPEVWYERRAYQVLISLIAGLVFWWLDAGLDLFFSGLLVIIGLSLYISGYVWDVYATMMVHQLKTWFDRAGLNFPIEEANPFLSKNPSLKELP